MGNPPKSAVAAVPQFVFDYGKVDVSFIPKAPTLPYDWCSIPILRNPRSAPDGGTGRGKPFPVSCALLTVAPACSSPSHPITSPVPISCRLPQYQVTQLNNHRSTTCLSLLRRPVPPLIFRRYPGQYSSTDRSRRCLISLVTSHAR
jgi:hypothetical protein